MAFGRLFLLRCAVLYIPGLEDQPPNKKPTKGEVLRKRKTSSLVRLYHSYVRNRKLELMNADVLAASIPDDGGSEDL
jgi:hypothetical protein